MADSTTTGSAVVRGTVPGGLQVGCGQVAGAALGRQGGNSIIFTYGSPQNVVTATTGSQIVHDIENKDFYMAKAVAGSTWNRLGSMT